MKFAVLAVLGAALLSTAPASAAEYECRHKRDGTFAGNPISMSDAKAWEDRNPGIDCFRKGVPVSSGRDQYQQQHRAEREERWERREERREERRALERDRWEQRERWEDRRGGWRNPDEAPAWGGQPARPYRGW